MLTAVCAFALPEGLLGEADVLPGARGETRGALDEPHRIFSDNEPPKPRLDGVGCQPRSRVANPG